jgi:type IV secretory pathway VirB2 component (pilin)
MILNLLTNLVGLATALVTLYVIIRTRRHVGAKVDNVETKVSEVVELVNGNFSTLTARVTQLTAALETSDTAVPPSPPKE